MDQPNLGSSNRSLTYLHSLLLLSLAEWIVVVIMSGRLSIVAAEFLPLKMLVTMSDVLHMNIAGLKCWSNIMCPLVTSHSKQVPRLWEVGLVLNTIIPLEIPVIVDLVTLQWALLIASVVFLLKRLNKVIITGVMGTAMLFMALDMLVQLEKEHQLVFLLINQDFHSCREVVLMVVAWGGCCGNNRKRILTSVIKDWVACGHGTDNFEEWFPDHDPFWGNVAGPHFVNIKEFH
jgi:hypothetical protein